MAAPAPILTRTLSQIGRITERETSKLKAKVEELDEQLRKPQKDGKESSLPVVDETDSAAVQKRQELEKQKSQQHLMSSIHKKSPAMAQALRDVLNMPGASVKDPVVEDADDQVPQADMGEGKEQLGPASTEKPSISFSAAGQDHDRYDHATMALCKRFAAPPKDGKPPVGHYRPNDMSVAVRNPDWDFAKTIGRNARKNKVDYFGPDFDRSTMSSFGSPKMSSSQKLMMSTVGSMASTSASGFGALSPTADSKASTWSDWGKETFGVMSPHKDLWGKGALAPGRHWTTAPQPQFQEVSTPREDIHQQIVRTTRVVRPPEWDFVKTGKRSSAAKKNFFEPGKYDIKRTLQDRDPNMAMTHDRQTSHDAPIRNRSAPVMALHPEQPGKAMKVDRSMHRSNSLALPRCTHVMKMEDYSERPPLMVPSAVYHDEDDPETDAVVMQRQMTVDKSTLDKSVVARKDLGVEMKRSCTRQVGGRGFRLLASKDCGSHKYPETLGERECSIDACKERPSRLRPDMGITTFDSYNGRQKGTSINMSSLRKPRYMMAADFERMPEFSDFAPRITAKVPEVLRQHRSFEPLPGFDVATFEAAMMADET